MKRVCLLVAAAMAAFASNASAQVITCDLLEKAATSIYRRTAEAANRGEIVLAYESSKAFWDVVAVENTCPRIVKLADEMRSIGLAEKMAALTLADVMGSYKNSLGIYCGANCQLITKKGPTGRSQGYEIETFNPKKLELFDKGMVAPPGALTLPSR